MVFHRQECGSTMRAPQALWRAVWSAAVGSAALWSTVLTTAEVPTTLSLPEAVGLWLDLMLWQTGIERPLEEEEVDLFQLMLKASFLKLDLLALQSFRESPPLPPKKRFFERPSNTTWRIISVEGVSFIGISQSFCWKKTLLAWKCNLCTYWSSTSTCVFA